MSGDARVVRDVFSRSPAELEQVLVTSEVPTGRAHSLATVTIAATEGAILLARAEGSTTPLSDVCSELQVLLASAGRALTGAG